MEKLRSLIGKIGLDKSIAYSSAARIVQAAAGVGSMFFISLFLSGVEQGFFFTFNSLLVLQIFFELGLTGILTQYVAHEASHLTLVGDTYVGDNYYLSRLASLVKFCTGVYAVLSLLLLAFLLGFGFFYFNLYGDTQGETVSWRIPWIIICIATAIKMYQSPFMSILTGLGYVKEMSKITFYQQVCIPLTMWIGLGLNCKLYVVGISYALSVLLWQWYVGRTGLFRLLYRLHKVTVTDRIAYFKEIFPYQWRIAFGWASSSFVFQFCSPVFFAVEGAVVAGQMGMTLQALNAISSLSLSWLNTKIPLYSRLIALKDYVTLDTIFSKTLKQMVAVCCCLLAAFLVTLYALQQSRLTMGNVLLADRFLDILPTILLIIPIILQQYINSWTTYIRCHKREPFLPNSIVTGFLNIGAIVGLGYAFGLYGITLGCCVIAIVVFPWWYHTYYTHKVAWHKDI